VVAVSCVTTASSCGVGAWEGRGRGRGGGARMRGVIFRTDCACNESSEQGVHLAVHDLRELLEPAGVAVAGAVVQAAHLEQYGVSGRGSGSVFVFVTPDPRAQPEEGLRRKRLSTSPAAFQQRSISHLEEGLEVLVAHAAHFGVEVTVHRHA
jgi:hypothetical protein